MGRLVVTLVALALLSGCVPYKNTQGQTCMLSLNPLAWVVFPATGGGTEQLNSCAPKEGS